MSVNLFSFPFHARVSHPRTLGAGVGKKTVACRWGTRERREEETLSLDGAQLWYKRLLNFFDVLASPGYQVSCSLTSVMSHVGMSGHQEGHVTAAGISRTMTFTYSVKQNKEPLFASA